MLKLTESYTIEGYIVANATYSAKQIKDQLKAIVRGAGENGGSITMTYEDESITGYIEDITIKPIPEGRNIVVHGYTGKDAAEYEVTIKFLKGVNYSDR